MNKIASTKIVNVNPATVHKWVRRYVSERRSGLKDRFSRPQDSLRATPLEQVEEIIRLRKNGKLTGDHIDRKLNLLLRTVSRHLVCAKLSRQEEIVERDEEPPLRYEHKALGCKVHLDIQKLSVGRAGRNFQQ